MIFGSGSPCAAFPSSHPRSQGTHVLLELSRSGSEMAASSQCLCSSVESHLLAAAGLALGLHWAIPLHGVGLSVLEPFALQSLNFVIPGGG